MHRFFVEIENIKEDYIEINDEDVKHIKNVLRLEVGDTISICDKQETDYICNISEINKNNITCMVIDKFKSKGEPPIDIVLYQGLPKSDKMELIVQKSTELGVKKIVPVMTNRTIVKIQDRKKEDKKLERWTRIAEEASKQSKRGMIPEISNIVTFKEMLDIFKGEETVIVPYESEENIGIKQVLKNCNSKKINILIGPEGGFEDEEIESLKSINCNIVTLGPRILRTETAGFTTSAIVLYELGDLGVI
ncbi:ribosomal RNA small subunit methyltransferase E [Gottschalkia acidurici 9a]|uniref:Ribosomal RNA small subunit methyltransferase E n=1 Tax=Gottschalkia acidurici (strain ATCC 7906 / DSM 604 / BCRC 14475 / CIP 104303 / KCTC 5404 / NCIMB 10678 / 9a) TaxID=1128398 RepID=K0B1K1_GOTA9|nr:16S rRNA (uracil(1498)-N(3))-methyltransferase [Gottschalkia acidurici]AFS78830.1 ribosomal RNA small subunit methyltransferase E [Gottschalkia acidurici 9a]